METHEIAHILKSFPGTGGVFAIDQLPAKHSLPFDDTNQCFLVANLDPSYKPGSHWVALRISSSDDSLPEYFDSFGFDAPPRIERYLNRNYMFQDEQLQSELSTVCGQWCIFYVWKRTQGFTLEDIAHMCSHATCSAVRKSALRGDSLRVRYENFKILANHHVT